MSTMKNNWDKEYRGLSGTKQHMFSDAGNPAVAYVFDTLDDALKEFGPRIKINDGAYKFSAGYRAGFEAATYAPRTGADKQERLEYGLGYMRKRLNQPSPASKTIAKDNSAKKPYAPEQLANTPYVGTTSERMDRAAGGPELRKKIADSVSPSTLSQSIAAIARKRGRPSSK